MLLCVDMGFIQVGKQRGGSITSADFVYIYIYIMCILNIYIYIYMYIYIYIS